MKARALMVLLAVGAIGCDAGPTQPTPGCQYSVSPMEFTPCMRPWQGTATVFTQTGCTWTVTPSASWITIGGPAGASGPGSFAFTVSENYLPPREATIQVRQPGASDSQIVRVIQAGCLYSLSPESTTVPATGTDGSFDVWQMALPNECGGPRQDACLWSARADAAWITVLTGSGRGDERVTYRVAANDSPFSRAGTITVQDKLFQITQMGR